MDGPVRGGRAMIAAMAPRLDPRRWRFVLVQPDTAPQLLGAAIGTFREDEGVTALKMLAGHPATAKFIATKLARHFVADEPPVETVDRLDSVFLTAPLFYVYMTRFVLG